MFSFARSSPTGRKDTFQYPRGPPCVAALNVPAPLTRQEAGHLSGIAVVGDASSGGAQVGAHGGEGQQLPAVVSVLGVHLQQAPIGGEVSEKAGLDVVRAVHLTRIDEGREGVHLLPHVALTEHVARVAGTAGRRRAEERHAVLGVAGGARVAPGDLGTAGWGGRGGVVSAGLALGHGRELHPRLPGWGSRAPCARSSFHSQCRC